MGITMEKIKEMVDVNTVVGDPITTPDGTTLIPVSKVSFGFASGGTDGTNLRFGAGAGAGLSFRNTLVTSAEPAALNITYNMAVLTGFSGRYVREDLRKLSDLGSPILTHCRSVLSL